MIDPKPIQRLKDEDRAEQPPLSLVPAPADPQALMTEFRRVARDYDATIADIDRLLDGFGADPIGTIRRVRERVREIRDLPGLDEIGGQLSMAYRKRGLFSTTWGR